MSFTLYISPRPFLCRNDARGLQSPSFHTADGLRYDQDEAQWRLFLPRWTRPSPWASGFQRSAHLHKFFTMRHKRRVSGYRRLLAQAGIAETLFYRGQEPGILFAPGLFSFKLDMAASFSQGGAAVNEAPLYLLPKERLAALEEMTPPSPIPCEKKRTANKQTTL